MDNIETIISPDTQRENRIPPGQRLTDKWPILHYGSPPPIEPAQWTLTISGLVERKTTITYQEFLALPRIKVFSDIHCVTGWSRLDNLWEGVSTQSIKELVNLLAEARFVMVRSYGGFSTNLTVDDFFQPDVLLAIKHNNQPLSAGHGYPMRLVVPRLYFWKSAKWVTGVEFTDEDQPGFWESYGYHNHGDPWKEERYSN
jgi:DMSO/TMAO reductase YedYZ molybdopterin-dependent catalytic subunit